MRVASLGVARPAYYDRNATSQTIQYVADIAPHGTTLRATYTTPAGKKAYIEAAAVYMRCSSAPTAAGRNFAIVRVTDASANLIEICRIDKNANTVVGNSYAVTSTSMPTVYAGETITIYTNDASTGGTVDYVIGAKVTQFDA